MSRKIKILTILVITIGLNIVHADGDTTNVFVRYDQVKKVLQEWNTAIDNNQLELLNNLYADTVDCYLKRLSKKECIESKQKWLKEHIGYHQKIEYLEIYYLDDDTLGSFFIAEFTKVCVEKNETVKVDAVIHFARFANDWKIIKESDRPSEASLAEKMPGGILKAGKNIFRFGYWVDTREEEDFGHDQVPYWDLLTLNVGTKITGEYLRYSGRMREIYSHLVLEGTIKNGILEITVVFNENQEWSLETYNPDEVPDSQKEHWHFKIVNGNELVGIDKEQIYFYGRSMFLTTPE